MNTRLIYFAGVLSLAALLAQIQNAVCSVAYTNSLKNGDSVLTDFTDYSTINSDYIDALSGAWFIVDTNNGLSLISSAPNYLEGIGVYNQTLAASNDWTITVQAHLSKFTNSQTNPFYSVGISLVKSSAVGMEYPNRVDLNLSRSGDRGDSLKNFIVSSRYINNGQSDTVINRDVAEAYLQFKYSAIGRILTTAYSTNGINFSPIQAYYLPSIWGIKSKDAFSLALTANDQPDGRVVPNYSITEGQIFLKNLTIVSRTGQTNTNQVGVGSIGGSLSTANGGLFNAYYGGVTIAGDPQIYTNAYTNISGSWTLNTNILTNGAVTNGWSNTNILTNGAVTNGWSNSLPPTNPGAGVTNGGVTPPGGPGGLPGGIGGGLVLP